ncbi:hypothetical protein [Pareuzebyella sediminis]|uniref:hypothetical protein n=1 Tax=Pareuzebyella sediminis TaxID=2607998 RepID=UPI0011EBDEB6|nr:hypothetical protein [Pareuzebyella sediminis]
MRIMEDFWTNYWHLIVAGLFAFASLWVLHVRKEEKAKLSQKELEKKIDTAITLSVEKTIKELKGGFDNLLKETDKKLVKSTQASVGAVEKASEKIIGDVQSATEDLKKETLKLTDNIKYGNLTFTIVFDAPVMNSEYTEFLSKLPQRVKREILPNYLIENYVPELSFYNNTEKKKVNYFLETQDFELTGGRAQNPNKNVVYSRHDGSGDEFSITLKFKLFTPLDFDMEKFLNCATAHFRLRLKYDKYVWDDYYIRDFISNYLRPQPNKCYINFTNVSENIKLDFVKHRATEDRDLSVYGDVYFFEINR